MTPAPTLQPLRLWPGVIALTAQWLLWFALPLIDLDAGMTSVAGAAAATLAILIWWLFFSRVPWADRLGGLVVIVAAVLATYPFLHRSIQNGSMGMMFYIFSVPGLSLALVAGTWLGRRWTARPRRAVTIAAILLASGAWMLLRTDGISGMGTQLAWRWTPTAEERLLAQTPAVADPVAPPLARPAPETPANPPAVEPGVAPAPIPAVAAPAKTPPEWPGFRGPNRDGIVRGVRINTGWSQSPPVEIWRRPIGPGWSSFAVHGDLLYTQEQRGDGELVASYQVSTGKPVWTHRDATRFWESNGGAGPRGTPTLANGRVYTLGATGIFNALDAATGALLWSRNAASDTGVKIPTWGIASSPLVIGDAVIVAPAGTLAAYDAATGKSRWVGPPHSGSYTSPHLATINGVPQILLLSAPGAIGVSPATGALLWEHKFEGAAIVQPALTADGNVLINGISMTGGVGMRRLAIAQGPSGWTAEERWTSNGLKPYFSDFVIHNGHALGFDGSILSCIDLTDGKRKWKGGRYGNGQLLLLADQDLLLVLSEEGELALVSATTSEFKEIARFKAIEGKTWNHPVLTRDTLLVRNGEEMAAFRLPL